MKKKKGLIGICIGCVILLVGIILFFMLKEDKNLLTRIPVTEASGYDESSVKETQYDNLIIHDFKTSVDAVDKLYNIEILSDNSYKDRTFLENFEIMKKVIDGFFMEDFDKSYITADFYISDEETISVAFDDIEKQCTDEMYNLPSVEFLFGDDTGNGGYMVQIDEGLRHIWFSRNGLGGIQPSMSEYKQVYPYISGKRQIEDVELNLKDGKIKLSEMEENVLSFLNEKFPMEVSENIKFCIGDVRVLDNGEYDGICFKVRRVYKGIPFEYGSAFSEGMYVDELDSDGGEISYAESTYPDTMLAFGNVNGTIVEKETITEMIPLDNALGILSEKIGKNSIYDVYGVELVYRECEIPKEREEELDAILKPMWKIITINQNDDKYTIFYVDVVTGDITERFEYYYE